MVERQVPFGAIGAALLAAGLGVQSASADVLETVFNDSNGITYHVLTTNSWTESQAEAESLGGNLATVRNQAEQDWIATTFGSYGYLWIGFTDQNIGGQFEWVSGESVTYTNWCPGEPNGGGGENWAHLEPTGCPEQWNDNRDDQTFHGVVEIISAVRLHSIDIVRAHYDHSISVTLTGFGFSDGGVTTVLFDNAPATNLVVLDDATITCDTPLVEPGQLDVDVTVTNDNGSDALADVFTFTPAIQLDGDWVPGGDLVLTYRLNPGDNIYAIYGLPPILDINTPPFDGQLCIVPFYTFFLTTGWPFDTWEQTFGIPYDPALAGLDVLFQGLIGSEFGGPSKDAAWTNCATLAIE